MNECRREQDVVDAVSSGRWPDRADETLRAHVASCGICAEVAVVARVLQEDHESLWRDARVPPPGRVWWRAELRAHQEAARRAAQPIALMQGLAGACAVGLLAALVQLAWPWLSDSAAALSGGNGVALLLPLRWPLAIALAAPLVLAPVALYFVFSDK